MKLKGTLSIHRRSGGSGPDYGSVILVLTDESSRAKFVEIDIPFYEFGMAVTGASEQPCEFEVRMKAPLGKRHEHKTELVPEVPFRDEQARRAALAAEILAPFEVDGWRGTLRDLFNNHKRRQLDGGVFFEVAFHRYVDPETGEPVIE